MTRAAAALGISKGVVSSHLRSLEKALGVTLLERTTRRMALTAVGQEVLSAAERMLTAADDALQAAATARGTVSGTLRLACPISLARHWVRPVLVQLRKQHPQLRVEVQVSDRPINLVAAGIDVAIRGGIPIDSSDILRILDDDEEVIVAAPAVAARWPAADPSELTDTPWLSHSIVQPQHRFHHVSGRTLTTAFPPPVIKAASTDLLRDLAVDGVGMTILPRFMVGQELENGSLVEVLPGWIRRAVKIYALIPSRPYPRRTSVFLELIDEMRVSRQG